MCNKNIVNVNESVSDAFQSIISALALEDWWKPEKAGALGTCQIQSRWINANLNFTSSATEPVKK